MRTIQVVVELPLDEAEAAAADDYPKASSIFASTRARARFGAACSTALAIHRVEVALAEFQAAQR